MSANSTTWPTNSRRRRHDYEGCCTVGERAWMPRRWSRIVSDLEPFGGTLRFMRRSMPPPQDPRSANHDYATRIGRCARQRFRRRPMHRCDGVARPSVHPIAAFLARAGMRPKPLPPAITTRLGTDKRQHESDQPDAEELHGRRREGLRFRWFHCPCRKPTARKTASLSIRYPKYCCISSIRAIASP